MLIGKNLAFLRKSRKLTQEQLANELRVKRTVIANTEAENSNPSLETLVAISEYFSVVLDDFIKKDLTDHASLNASLNASLSQKNVHPIVHPKAKKQSNDSSKMPVIVTVDEGGKDNITLVDVKAAAGYIKHLHEPVFYKKLPAIKLPGSRFKNGVFRGFQVEGNSMSPKLRNDYWVIGSYLEQLQYIKDDQVYVIVTKEKVCVKRLLNRIEQRQKIVLKSDNRDYDLEEVSVTDIQEIWDVVLYFGWDLSNPMQDIFSQLNNLNERLHLLENKGR